jgi:hypothetical protein
MQQTYNLMIFYQSFFRIPLKLIDLKNKIMKGSSLKLKGWYICALDILIIIAFIIYINYSSVVQYK